MNLFLERIFDISSGSALTVLELWSISSKIMKHIPVSVESLWLDSLGFIEGDWVVLEAAGDKEGAILSKLVELRMLQLYSPFKNVNPRYLTSLIQLEELQIWVPRDLSAIQEIVRNHLPKLLLFTIITPTEAFAVMNQTEMAEATASSEESVLEASALYGKRPYFPSSEKRRFMKDINSSSDPFRELRRICRQRGIRLIIQRILS